LRTASTNEPLIKMKVLAYASLNISKFKNLGTIHSSLCTPYNFIKSITHKNSYQHLSLLFQPHVSAIIQPPTW